MKDKSYYDNLYNDAKNELDNLKNQVDIKTKELEELKPFADICYETIKNIEEAEERQSLEKAIRHRIQGKKSIEVYAEVGKLTQQYDLVAIVVDDEWISARGPLLLRKGELNSKYIQEVNDMYDEWLQLFDKKIEEICNKYNFSITEKTVSSITSFRYTIANSKV